MNNHQEQQDKFKDLWQSVSKENLEIDKATDERIWQGIEARIKQKKKNNYSFYWIAATLIPIFGLLVYLFNGKSENVAEQKLAKLEFSNTTDGKKQIQLADGTSVLLGKDAVIKLDKDFGKTNRNVELSHNADFKVSKNKKLPFVINADGFKVSVLGTQFHLTQTEGRKKVELIEGKVKINSQNEEIYLKPNMIWLWENGTEKVFFSKSAIKTFSYVDGNFDNAIRELEKIYNVKIDYPNRYKNEKVDGSFSGDFNEIINIIGFPFGLSPKYINDQQVILK